MTLDSIDSSKMAVRMTSPACMATTMASVVVVKSPVSSSFSSSSVPTRKPGSSRQRSWPERSYAMARARQPMVHPAKGHHPQPSWHGLQTVIKQDTPCVHVIDDDEDHLSKSGQLLL